MRTNPISLGLLGILVGLAGCGGTTTPPDMAVVNVDGAAPVDQGGATVDQGAPAVDQGAPAVDQGAPAVDQGAPAVDQGAPAVDQGAPAVDQGAPTVDQGAPAVDHGAPAVDQGAPAVDQSVATSDQAAPADMTVVTACPAPGPGTLATDAEDPGALFVDPQFAFWVATRAGLPSVWRAPKAGGSVMRVGPSSGVPTDVTVVGDTVDWIDFIGGGHFGGTGVIRTASRSGVDARILAEAPHPFGAALPEGLAADATRVFYTEDFIPAIEFAGEPIGRVYAVDMAGNQTLLAQGLPAPFGIAVDDTFVYWSDRTGAISRVARTGGAVTQLAAIHAPGSAPRDLVLAGDTLYVGDESGALFAVPEAGGAPTTVYTGEPDAPIVDLAVDATSVYFIAGGAVQRVSRAGGAATLLARGDPTSIAVDDSFVYYTDRQAATVVRACK